MHVKSWSPLNYAGVHQVRDQTTFEGLIKVIYSNLKKTNACSQNVINNLSRHSGV